MMLLQMLLTSMFIHFQVVLSTGLVAHEVLDGLPRGWAVGGIPSPDQPLTLEIQLRLSNIDNMVEELYAVSTPGSPQYGQHWTKDQVDALVQPCDEAFLATVGWLNASNIGPGNIVISPASIRFQTTVWQANLLLNTSFLHYEHSGIRKLRTTGYRIHKDVAAHVDFIHPTTFFGEPRKNKVRSEIIQSSSKRSLDSECGQGLTPLCIRQLYNIPANFTPYNTVGASIGFSSFLNQTAQSHDSDLYATKYGFNNQSFAVVLINGAVNNQSSAVNANNLVEANMDAQLIAGVSHPLPITEYIVGGSPPVINNLDDPAGNNTNEPYLEYYNYLLSLENENIPQVISQSYGDDEDSVPLPYAIRTCNLIAMLGLRGITILHSSGDLGVGSACRASTGKLQFQPIFPASCPFVVAIGGTQNASDEVAWSGSSGGFSNYFPRPTYQESAVNEYLSVQVSKSTKQYYSAYTNFSGRAFPDVAALSSTPGYLVYIQGVLYRDGGTSAAAPVWAGIIALLNDARLQAGKPALGWLNPLLYGSGRAALRDITAGQSVGCNGKNSQNGQTVQGGGIILGAHWNATEGWDPVTGNGVPNFSQMLDDWVAL